MQVEPDNIPATNLARQRPSPLLIALLAAILVGSFFIRAYRPLSRSQLWPNRAESFLSAVRDQRWDSTFQSRHPGVTTMAIGALTYAVFEQVEGTAFEGLFVWGAPPWASRFGLEVAIAMLGLTLVIVLLLLAITLALRRLGGWTLAICTLVLVSFSPFYLAQSRVFHVDALATTFMLLSALLILLYLEQSKWIYLVLSGLTGGLALLTKTPSVFLIPFTGLSLLVYTGVDAAKEWADHTKQERVRWILSTILRRIVVPLLIWLLVALLLFPLWPALWEDPISVLSMVLVGASEHVENPHVNERFFAGHIYINQPPPITYYPASLLYRMTFITLVFLIVSLLMMTVWRKRRLVPLTAPTYWLLIAYVAFFTIQMTISAKQIDRYILPAQIMLDVLGAVGLVGFANLIKTSLSGWSSSRRQFLGSAALVVPLALHLLVTLPFFPDFGAHFNYLLGGNRGAIHLFSFQGQNEGIFDVVKYLRDHPEISIGSEIGSDSIWRQFDTGTDRNPPYTHELVSVVDVRRHRIDLDRLAENYANQPPELTVSFDNVIYYWLFPINATPDVSTTQVKHGWAGFTIAAWVLTAALAAVVVYAVRRSPPDLDST